MLDKFPILSLVRHYASGLSALSIANQSGLSRTTVTGLLSGKSKSVGREKIEQVINACVILRAQKSMKSARHDYISQEKQRLYEKSKRVAKLKFTRKEIQFIAKQERGDSELSTQPVRGNPSSL